MKFSACNDLYEGWTIEDVFESLKEIGYDGVEIAPCTLADSVESIPLERRVEIRRAADKLDLEIVGLHQLMVKPDGLHLCHPDPNIRNRTVSYFRSLIELCCDLGGRVMVCGADDRGNVMTGQGYEDAWDTMKESFCRVLPLAAQRGVAVCLEPQEKSKLVRTADEALKMIHEINHPSLRLDCSIRSMCAEAERNVIEIIAAGGEQVTHIHANDANGHEPGSGDTDFRPIFKALKDIRYIEYVSVQPLKCDGDPASVASKSLNYLKACLEEVEADLT